ALDCDVLSFHVTKFTQPCHETFQNYAVWNGILRTAGRKNTYARYRCSLLRPSRERPISGKTEQRNEVPSPHSMTSSARPSNVSGTESLSAFAVFKFIRSSKLVAC